MAVRLIASLSFGAALLAAAPASAAAPTILFIGNSFTFGGHAAVWKYRADTVHDLNRGGVGGVPALFKLFADEAGLDYDVSVETSPGKTLEWHWQHEKSVVDRAWDHVVLQDHSVLDPAHPGDPTKTIDYAGRFARLFTARNPKVEISLTATWSRPDYTYLKSGHWYGQPITAMALDLQRDYKRAAAASPAIDKVNPVGRAFNCAIAAGLGDANPYDGIDAGKLDLWAYDFHHASTPGYYLTALTVFIDITGKDPRAFGPKEQAAAELGISPTDAVRLQRVAWANAHGMPCTRAEIGGPKVSDRPDR